MAVMVGRFIHYYPAYTAEAVLAMPLSRFLTLSRAISRLVASERLERLEDAAIAAHPGEKGDGYAKQARRLLAAVGGGVAAVASRFDEDAPRPGEDAFAGYEAEPGSIDAERARQKAAWEALLAARGVAA